MIENIKGEILICKECGKRVQRPFYCDDCDKCYDHCECEVWEGQ